MTDPVTEDLINLAEKYVEKNFPQLNQLVRKQTFYKPIDLITLTSVNPRYIKNNRYGPEFEKVLAKVVLNKIRAIKSVCKECNKSEQISYHKGCDFSKHECMLKKLACHDEIWEYIDRKIITMARAEVDVNDSSSDDFIRFVSKSDTEIIFKLSGKKSTLETHYQVLNALKKCRNTVLLRNLDDFSFTEKSQMDFFPKEPDVNSNTVDLGSEFVEKTDITLNFSHFPISRVDSKNIVCFSSSLTLVHDLSGAEGVSLLKSNKSIFSTLFWPPSNWFIFGGNHHEVISFSISSNREVSRIVDVQLPCIDEILEFPASCIAFDLKVKRESRTLRIMFVAVDMYHNEIEFKPRSIRLR
jgi:hypothetical protein